MKIVGYLEGKHHANCALHDPTPDDCDCGAVSVPLVRLADAQAAVRAAIAARPSAAGADEGKDAVAGALAFVLGDDHRKTRGPKCCNMTVVERCAGCPHAAGDSQEPTAWNPMDTAPKDGQPIYVQQQAVFRWLPYKPNSQERQRGKKGRWQKHDGYGFSNAELVGSGWRYTDAARAGGETS